MCIVLCSKGYPDETKKKVLINDINKIKFDKNQFCYHAGTTIFKEGIYATGGRVLNFVSLSSSFKNSRERAVKLIDQLNWKNGFFRKDIGFKIIDK